ncbi:MAG TPA: Hsp33 family molecular chaperone HslO [Desulfuromonadaceae bacterium]|jgi:molecular chaperone Hsp33
MNDHIVRGISNAGGIRALVCTAGNLAREICELQQTSATVSIALSRGLAGGALMGALLKEGQRVALKFEGNGPLNKLLIEADSDGAVRGCAGNPAAEAEPVNGKWNVPGILGKAGFLTVSKDLGLGAEPYRGMVQLSTSEIGDDLALYLTDSEQIPSAVGVGAVLDQAGHVVVCGGFLVQALPLADETEIEEIMSNISVLPPISELLHQDGPDALLAKIFGKIPYTHLETRDIFFRCGCSREKVEQAMLSFSREELVDIIAKGEDIDITCEYCRQTYRLGRSEISKLLLPSAAPSH